MSDEQPPEILSGLPRTRPHRRSSKRTTTPNGARAAAAKATTGPRKPTSKQAKPRSEALRQPKQPAGTPPTPATRRPLPPSGPEILSTVVHAAAELVEIGVSASARAVRDALSRLPRP